MKIEPRTTKQQVEQMMAGRMQVIEQAVLSRLQFVGEIFVKLAREEGAYKDRTGNLRNSIGYIILKNGEQLFENFEKSAHVEVEISKGKLAGQTHTTKGSADGVAKGKEVAELASLKFPKGYVLIVVAGMEYAAAVEAKGLDVLTGSSQQASKLLKQGFDELQQKLKKIA